MIATKRKKLENAGWKVGSVAEFLGLNAEEELLVEMKIALAARIKELRQQFTITQQQFADQIGSSQSRVAKIEAADKSVSIDLLIRALVSLGESRQDIGAIVIGSQSVARSRSTRRKQNARAKGTTARNSEEAKTHRKTVSSRK